MAMARIRMGVFASRLGAFCIQMGDLGIWMPTSAIQMAVLLIWLPSIAIRLAMASIPMATVAIQRAATALSAGRARISAVNVASGDERYPSAPASIPASSAIRARTSAISSFFLRTPYSPMSIGVP